ncbi:MAG: murein hydrolase activator EnvC family protein [Burkholderiaceae bacterium]
MREKLSTLKQDIERTEASKGRAADALAAVETRISEADRTLHDLDDRRTQTQARLDELNRRRNALSASVSARQKQLAAVLRSQYVRGGDDRLRLLLSGENPNGIQRDLQYLGYLSKAQASLVESLRADLKQVEDNRTELAHAADELDDIAGAQRAQKAVLEKEKSRRTTLLAQLSKELDSQRREAGAVARDEARLTDLVGRLDRLIAEQRRAEAAERERQRRELAERRRAELAQEQERKGKRMPKPAEPARNVTPESAKADDAVGLPDTVAGRSFAALRGRMPWPVRGELAARFGSRRDEGPPWKGLLIRAPEGSEVHAIAAGKVVFADWLRGFGNLMIIDHGGDYLSIYGNNQALLKRPGDAVSAGEAIARAGSSGGSAQSGLYFEMRHFGRPFDPLDWITPR